MRYIDLTRTVTEDISVYPGDPCPIFNKLNDVEQDGFEMYEVTSGMHVGTHMDAPLHFVKDGKQINEVLVEQFVGRGIVVEHWNTAEIRKDDIVLVKTGHENLWNTDAYFTTYPAVPIEFARICVERKIKILCVDMPSVDYEPFEVHKLLLGNGILIVENVCNLGALDGINNLDVVALPAKYATEAAPCRLVARY